MTEFPLTWMTEFPPKLTDWIPRKLIDWIPSKLTDWIYPKLTDWILPKLTDRILFKLTDWINFKTVSFGLVMKNTKRTHTRMLIFVLCLVHTPCCKFLWIDHSWFPLRFYLTFKYNEYVLTLFQSRKTDN